MIIKIKGRNAWNISLCVTHLYKIYEIGVSLLNWITEPFLWYSNFMRCTCVCVYIYIILHKSAYNRVSEITLMIFLLFVKLLSGCWSYWLFMIGPLGSGPENKSFEKLRTIILHPDLKARYTQTLPETHTTSERFGMRFQLQVEPSCSASTV